MTPNLPARPDDDKEMQRRVYLLSMFGYFIAVAISWNALRLLLLALGLDSVADVFKWIVLFAVVSGATRLALQHLYMPTMLRRRHVRRSR